MAIDASNAIDPSAKQRFRAEAIRRIVSKLDRRLIPFLFILEMSSYLNRNSIGHAKLMGIEADLHMSRSESDWAISIFFLGYLIFGIPSNLLLRFLDPTRYLSLSTISWGSITIGMAFGRTALFVSTCIACCSTFAACPLILSWLTNNVNGHTKRATAVGFVVCISQIGGIIAPQIYRDIDKPIYPRGDLICSGLLAVSLIAIFILRFSLKVENRRRHHLSTDQHDRKVAIDESCDWVHY